VIGQHDVHQGQVRWGGLGEVVERLAAIGGMVDDETVAFEHVTDEEGDVFFVFHHEDALAGGFAHA